MKNEHGQVILVLILVMTVALAIGISVVQRSLSDISTSTKVEESSRAFSAAEAGIERGLKEGSVPKFNLENNSSAEVTDQGLLPCVPGSSPSCPPGQQDALEFPALAREDVAQVWLADRNSSSNPPAEFYKPPTGTLDVYWGNSTTDRAALGLTLIYYEGGLYKTKKWYLDQQDAVRNNNFEKVACSSYAIGSNNYQCQKTITVLPSGLMLLRVRLLYNANSQPFAVQAVGNCGPDCSIPSQSKILVSTGTSGVTQRKVKLFQTYKVVPLYFDYALFSIDKINK